MNSNLTKILFLFFISSFLVSYKKKPKKIDYWDSKNFPKPIVIQKRIHYYPKKIIAAYKKAKKEGKATPVIDYSYAGYKHGEELPPYFPPKMYEKNAKVNGLKVFNVVDYGAKPNDSVEDFDAVKKAARALQKNGSGVLFFPKGRFIMNEKIRNHGIKLVGRNFLIKGSGASKNPKKGTILTMRKRNTAPKGTANWNVAPLLSIGGRVDGFRWALKRTKSKLLRPAFRGTHAIYLNDVSPFIEGGFISFRLGIRFNTKDKFFKYYFYKLKPHSGWMKGVTLINTYIIEKIDEKAKIVYTKEALFEDYINPNIPIEANKKVFQGDYSGIEDLYIECGWKGKFKHDPGNAIQDGWSAIKMNTSYSWVRQCVVANASNPIHVSGAYNTIYNCLVTGNKGHNGVSLGTLGRLSTIFNVKNNADSHHGLNIDDFGNVVWKYKSYSSAGPDHHAKNAQATLFDSCIFTTLDSHGGAHGHYPHHYRFLLFWNTRLTRLFRGNFWKGYYVVYPSFIGIIGVTPQIEGKIGYYMKIPPNPSSLYRFQLEHRTKKKAKHLDKILKDGKKFFSKWGIQ